ncbi:MAG: HDOD domain-containing protein [Sulfuricella sp.]|nr:HDOD domain-containing protein [Sulfuricella sp.]
MSALAMDRVVERVQQLPSLNQVVNEVLHSFDDEDVDIPSLVSKISRDQGLAARVLRVANSAFYGLSSHVSSVNEAVVVLGFYSIRSLVVAAGIINQFPNSAGKTFDRLEFWQHAIGVGVCAKIIAARLGQDMETAFTAGLLHDVGILVLDAYFHDEFEQVLSCRAASDCTIIEAEMATLQVTHAQIGYEVAKRWKFPLPIQLAIRDHHHPDQGAPALLTDNVHLANVLCHALEIGNASYDMVPPLSALAWERLGLSWDELGEMLGEIEHLNASANLLAMEE